MSGSIKSAIVEGLESVVGEFVLNISKENIKLSVLRGKLKLENVQLDGDAIGSLFFKNNDFCVLDCQAKSLKFSLNWNMLEKEPVRAELNGVNMLVVPITNSSQMPHAIMLRTKCKRSALARLERNFMGGKIPGEPTYLRGDGKDNDNNVERHRKSFITRLRQRALSNVEFAIRDIHIRVECPESAGYLFANNYTKNTAFQKFCFGLTIQSFLIRTTTEHWQTDMSEHNKKKREAEKSRRSLDERMSTGSSSESHYKLIELNKVSMYWDSDPLSLISQILLIGEHDWNSPKELGYITAAMNNLSASQHPGEAFVKSMYKMTGKSLNFGDKRSRRWKHDICCKPFTCEGRATFSSNKTLDLPSCFLEILPCALDCRINSAQYHQLASLRSILTLRQRFNNLLQTRPQSRPSRSNRKATREWWRYVIGCVVTRPRSRPWRDVVRITRVRPRYISLVLKKMLNKSEGSGFHRGLSREESKELTVIERFLPLEVLRAFHLLALRRAFDEEIAESNNERKRHSYSVKRIKKLIRGKSELVHRKLLSDPSSITQIDVVDSENDNQEEVFNATYFKPKLDIDTNSEGIRIKIDSFRISAGLLRHQHIDPFTLITAEFRGIMRSFESGLVNGTLDILKFDITDEMKSGGNGSNLKLLTVANDQTQITNMKNSNDINEISGPNDQNNLSAPNRATGTLPPFVACRISFLSDQKCASCHVASLPATFIWGKQCIGVFAETFLNSPATNLEDKFKLQLAKSATPLARKAFHAFLSPKALDVNLDIEAPKLLVPVSDRPEDGALYFDAGHLRIIMNKAERQINPKWTAEAMSSQIKFLSLFNPFENLQVASIPILLPFRVKMSADVSAEVGSHSVPEREIENLTTSTRIDIVIGEMSINLVDVDEVAKAIGRIYASFVKNRLKKDNKNCTNKSREGKQLSLLFEEKFESKLFVRINIPAIEMSVNGVNTSLSNFYQRKTYCVVFTGINFDMEKDNQTKAEIILKDLSIVQGKGSEKEMSNLPMERWRIVVSSCMEIPMNSSDIDQQNSINVSNVDLFLSPDRKHGISLDSSFISYTHDETEGQFSKNVAEIKYLHDGYVDEIEVDIKQLVVRATPTSLSDCFHGIRRIGEVIRIMGKEMERKVHEGRRRARSKANRVKHRKKEEKLDASKDSSLILKVIAKTTVLAGRPIVEKMESRSRGSSSAVVVQSSCDFLLMFQSIENVDGSGSRTIHISIDDLVSSIVNKFDPSPRSEVTPILGPISAELRAVYGTVLLGTIISKDFSFDCDTIQACFSNEDFYVVRNIYCKMMERLRRSKNRSKSSSPQSGFLYQQSRGSGVATNLRFEIQTCKLIFMRKNIISKKSLPFLDIRVSPVKGRFQGCVSAMSGEMNVILAINYFNEAQKCDWEHIIEPVPFVAALDQMPNEVTFNVASPESICLNVTSQFLNDFSQVDVELFFKRPFEGKDDISFSIFDSVCMRREDERTSITLSNRTGERLNFRFKSSFEQNWLDGTEHCSTRSFEIGLNEEIEICDFLDEMELESLFDSTMNNQCPTLIMNLSKDGIEKGRSHISVLPIFSSDAYSKLYKLTSLREESRDGLYEPVVEWCMQNQRLRASTQDVYALQKGDDLLSSIVWSPGDYFFAKEYYRDNNDCISFSIDEFEDDSDSIAPTSKGNWLPPDEITDAPEWTDMTCILRMERDGVMLPDTDWIWCNEWSVNICGEVGINTDSDGFEYQYDFSSFSKSRRGYKRGDMCRRRRWTRTRMIMPPDFDDPSRPLYFVWEINPDDSGTISICCRSHVLLLNNTDIDLHFFMYCPSWEDDKYVGQAKARQDCAVPILYASGTHLRLAVKKEADKSIQIGDRPENSFLFTERIMILPTSYVSSNIIRSSICGNKSKSDTRPLHVLTRLECENGIVRIHVNPVIHIFNLAPCAIQCQFGEAIPEHKEPCNRGAGMRGRGRLQIESSEDARINTVDPCAKPHLQLRVAGYKWSQWHRIVNRKSNSESWIPPEIESRVEFDSSIENMDHVGEYKAVVHFERLGGGDPLHLIMSVEEGHCPIIRIYAQYWVVNKTGLGLRFCEGISLLGSGAGSTSRRSYAVMQESLELKDDLRLSGHEWSIGMSGMSLFFSQKQKFSFRVECIGDDSVISSWSNAMDASNVIPKTVVSLEEDGGSQLFEFAVDIALCPGTFSRSKMITIHPRYMIVNLLDMGLRVSQYGCARKERFIQKQTSLPFHWTESSLPPQIRISSGLRLDNKSWSNGCIQLDQIGITAIRLPTKSGFITVQAEVRLAAKDQYCAVVLALWTTHASANPLYIIRNKSSETILCSQYLDEMSDNEKNGNQIEKRQFKSSVFWWTVPADEVVCFGLEDPQRPHILDWYVQQSVRIGRKEDQSLMVNIDSMGSQKYLVLSNERKICCQIKAERSTKVIEFTEITSENTENNEESDECIEVYFKLDLPGLSISLIENEITPREIIYTSLSGFVLTLEQGHDGRHAVEVMLDFMQIDNHIKECSSPVMLFCPNDDDNEPFIHIVALRRLQNHSNSYYFSYAALRILDIELFLDGRSAEVMAEFLQPIRAQTQKKNEAINDPSRWLKKFTRKMSLTFENNNVKAKRSVEEMALKANSGRIYFERLLLHPLRLSLTFTQAPIQWTSVTEGLAVFQLIKSMASITDAPLTFTSFAVDHAFEAPQALTPIISAHYTSQLTNQIFALLGSLTILRPGGDFLTNVGNGVKDFFYEPINGLMHSPRHFVEGLEIGTQSLARNLVLGISQSAANVTEVVNSNLTSLTDRNFIEERKAHRKMLAEIINRSTGNRSLSESFAYAGSSLVLGFKSGAKGIIEHPSHYASRRGTVGFLQGMGQGLVGAIVKPVIGLGDAAVLVMQHVSDAASEKMPIVRTQRRLRRALPITTSLKNRQAATLIPYEDDAAMAQKIITSGDNVDDVYLGHIKVQSDVIIASEKRLWIVTIKSKTSRCLSWEEISHFSMRESGGVEVCFFSSKGVKSFILHAAGGLELANIYHLLSLRMDKMANSPVGKDAIDHDSMYVNCRLKDISTLNLPGFNNELRSHLFGSVNKKSRWIRLRSREDTDVIEHCFNRVKSLGNELEDFFLGLDTEAWFLVDAWSQVYTGLNSRRRVVVGIINGTGTDIQIKQSRVEEGGSPCYIIPGIDYDHDQSILKPGGGMLLFAWGSPPSFNNAGKVHINLETNAFLLEISDRISESSKALPFPGYQVKILEKSFDENGWWAKFWLLVKKTT